MYFRQKRGLQLLPEVKVLLHTCTLNSIASKKVRFNFQSAKYHTVIVQMEDGGRQRVVLSLIDRRYFFNWKSNRPSTLLSVVRQITSLRQKVPFTITDITYDSKPDPFVVIVMKDSAKLGGKLAPVDVGLEFVHCGYEFKLQSNTAVVNPIQAFLYVGRSVSVMYGHNPLTSIYIYIDLDPRDNSREKTISRGGAKIKLHSALHSFWCLYRLSRLAFCKRAQV